MSEIKIPTNADEAAAMALIGMSWLEQNAQERLTELHSEIRAEAGRAGFVAGFKRRTALGPLRKMWSEEEIIELYNQYANSIRQGEVE